MPRYTPYTQPTDPPNPDGPGVPRQNPAKVGAIKELFYRARQERRPLLSEWTSNYELLHNRAWSQNRPAWQPSPAVAEIYPTVASITAWETDLMPTFDVTPYADPNSPYYTDLAQKSADLRVALQSNWQITGATTEIQKAVWDKNVYGTGILKATWNSHLHEGEGDAQLTRVDPFWFYPDPDATSLDDARYIVETYELADDQLEERFPGSLRLIGSGGEEDIDRSPNKLDERGSAPKANVAPIAPNTTDTWGRPGQGVSRMGTDISSQRHTVLEIWHLCNCGSSAHNKARERRARIEKNVAGTGVSADAIQTLLDFVGSSGNPSPKAPKENSDANNATGLADMDGGSSSMDVGGMDGGMGGPATDERQGLTDPSGDPSADPLTAGIAAELAGQPQPASMSSAPVAYTPTSHWHLTVISGDTILMDCPVDQIWGHGLHPYARVVAVDEGEFWGTSLVTLLGPLQRSINWLLAAIEQNIWLAGNPVFVEDNRSGLQRSKITNKPGQRITVNSQSRADWLNPPQIHPQLAMQLVNFYVGEVERISGLSAIVRGATPTGRNSQGVMDSIQEAAFVRIRLSLRNLESALRDEGHKMASLIAEFYTRPRIVAMVGPAGEKTIKSLQANHFDAIDDNGNPVATPIRFSLNVQAGSTLSTSRAARISEADTLYAMQAIDAEAVLQAHDFPNWPTVVARMREMQAAQGGPIDPGPSARTAAGRLT